ncbi:hypothetical protein SEUCBS140593_007301 [Sporothrix eucalyptigena]|uniref:Uncharacterized protein n=1 Tax=Sporothrix eucalyptigena TaxID=1812306 RepID=A0ABP0CD95_9PEZI
MFDSPDTFVAPQTPRSPRCPGTQSPRSSSIVVSSYEADDENDAEPLSPLGAEIGPVTSAMDDISNLDISDSSEVCSDTSKSPKKVDPEPIR